MLARGFGRGPCQPAFGGDKRDRTADPLLAKQVLSQLSYTPISFGAFIGPNEPQKLNNDFKKDPSKCFHFADLGVLKQFFCFGSP